MGLGYEALYQIWGGEAQTWGVGFGTAEDRETSLDAVTEGAGNIINPLCI